MKRTIIVVVSVVVVVLLAIAASLIQSGAAEAQPLPKPRLTGNIVNDIEAAKNKVNQDIVSGAISEVQSKSNPANNALQQLADFIAGDLSNASDLAISIPDTLDGNGQICLDAMKSASIVFQANPVPSVTDKQGLASALERIRLLAMTANKVCANPSCTQVFADASGALAQLAPLKMPAVPNLHDICSLIPTVALAKPTRTLPVAATPAATPSPSPTP